MNIEVLNKCKRALVAFSVLSLLTAGTIASAQNQKPNIVVLMTVIALGSERKGKSFSGAG